MPEDSLDGIDSMESIDGIDGIDSATETRKLVKMALLAIAIGALAGFASWLFIAADHYGFVFLWEKLPELVSEIPEWAVTVAVVAVTTLVTALIVVLWKGRPFDTGAAVAEYDRDGRMEYRSMFAGAGFSLGG